MADVSKEPPFFHGCVLSRWSSSKRYRVYVRPRELVFIYAGAGDDLERSVGVHFGLVGAAIASAITARKKKKQSQRLEGSSVDELLTSHKHNFRAGPSELSELTIDPRSYWVASFQNQPKHAGILRFTHPEKKRVTLCVDSVDDMKVAVENLPRAIGSHIVVNVQWDERKKKFVGKK
jgi:hypothetical protein